MLRQLRKLKAPTMQAEGWIKMRLICMVFMPLKLWRRWIEGSTPLIPTCCHALCALLFYWHSFSHCSLPHQNGNDYVLLLCVGCTIDMTAFPSSTQHRSPISMVVSCALPYPLLLIAAAAARFGHVFYAKIKALTLPAGCTVLGKHSTTVKLPSCAS